MTRKSHFHLSSVCLVNKQKLKKNLCIIFGEMDCKVKTLKVECLYNCILRLWSISHVVPLSLTACTFQMVVTVNLTSQSQCQFLSLEHVWLVLQLIIQPAPGLRNMRDPGILDPRHFFFPRHFFLQRCKLTGELTTEKMLSTWVLCGSK